MSQDLTGIDSNVLIYAFDTSEARKHRTASKLVPDLIESGEVVLSVQNLTEFFFVSTNHIESPIQEKEALSIVEDFNSSQAEVKSIRPEHSVKAASINTEKGIDFWDCLLAETLKQNNVDRIITENTQDFQEINGIEAENPFD